MNFKNALTKLVKQDFCHANVAGIADQQKYSFADITQSICYILSPTHAVDSTAKSVKLSTNIFNQPFAKININYSKYISFQFSARLRNFLSAHIMVTLCTDQVDD